MKTIAGLVLLALPLTAAAQPGAAPYYAAPPPQPVAAQPAESKVRLEIGLLAASPKGDWDQIQAETSPGFGLQLGFRVSPGVDLFGGLRYVRVDYDEEALGVRSDSELEISHRELQVGVRFTTALSPGAKGFLEGNIHSATLAASFEGESESESGLGVGVRGGIVFMADRNIGIGVAVGYASADITGENTTEEFEDAWLTGDAFVSFGF